MTKDKDNKYKTSVFYVVKMLEDIPKDLVDLFTPDDEDGLVQLELNIIKWLARVQERTKVMQLQKHHSLLLRPNQSLRDVTIRLKILELKKRKTKFSDNDRNHPPLDEGSSDV